jgi:CRP/FNR family cyclic AMP-dependent transcriptional regulator
MNKF